MYGFTSLKSPADAALIKRAGSIGCPRLCLGQRSVQVLHWQQIDAAVTTYEDKCIDSFVLGNPHESLFPAMYGTTQIEGISALGILETYDAASIIEAADQAAKTAIVDVIELRIAKGMCGKSYMLLTGEVSAVEASIEKAKQLVASKGMYLDSSVIAHPDQRMIDSIL